MSSLSLRSRIAILIASLVLTSSALLTILATHRYAFSLHSELQATAENLALSLSQQTTDFILINDIVSLQKLIAQEQRNHPDIIYIFVLQDNEVLASTMDSGVPVALGEANIPDSPQHGRMLYITSEAGEEYLDIAWPIFEGKAGILRMGFSEKRLFANVGELWRETALLAGCILIVALFAGFAFTRRLTTPLQELVQATKELDASNFEKRVKITSNDEIGNLGQSFNHMAQRLQKYVTRIEEQASDLERLYMQLSMAYEVIHKASTLRGLHEIGAFVLESVRERITCSEMTLFVLDSTCSNIFIISANESSRKHCPEIARNIQSSLRTLPPFVLSFEHDISPEILPAHEIAEKKQGIIPLHCEGQLCGFLAIFCPRSCSCSLLEADFVALVLAHTAPSIVRAARQEEEIKRLTSRLESVPDYCGIVGRDASMQVIYKLIEDVAPTDATALIQGESGTGKELVARAIHEKSNRKDKPFVVINCSAYPETLLESELFGHEKGAFTGALKQRAGRFEQADGGTVFLDEIGEISLQAQVKLLRVLQTRQLERLGCDTTIHVNVRIIAATNKDLLQEVKTGAFREDLYYRLDVVSMSLPPLRERGNDIQLLAQHFLESFAAEQGKLVTSIGPRAMRMLLDYDWPGNVRELENVMEQSVIVARASTIHREDLPSKLQQGAASVKHSTILDHERNLLLETLEECNWNKSHAAERLGIGRSTLYAKLRKFRITSPDDRV